MTINTDTPNSTYLTNWLTSTTAKAPIIVASYNPETLDKTVEYVAKLNTGHDTIYLEEDNNSYKIKETRELINTLSRTSFSTQRLIIIKLAEKLTLPAVNALLKSLEEPSIQNKWLLTTKQLPLILPTIKSRCEILRINDSVPTSQDDKEFWKELVPHTRGDKISEESLTELHNYLTKKIRYQGPSPHIFRVLLRLRDYHKIKSHRGNTKLARDVLLASLYQLRNN